MPKPITVAEMTKANKSNNESILSSLWMMFFVPEIDGRANGHN
jgi:hypothetical protein